MARDTKKSFCRLCQAFCAVEVDVDDGRVVSVRGHAGDPMTGGYTCMKGRQLPEQMNDPARLRGSRKRSTDGKLQAISSEQAMDEIAERVSRIIREHGPRAVAIYAGTFGYYNSATMPTARAWLEGVGSPSFYTSLTIDQPAKVLAVSRIGLWGGGTHSFVSSDVALVVGNNPLVSHLAPPSGVSGFNPSRSLREAKERGLRLICVDPRRSELARRADIHIQVRPGEDPTLLAGMLRVILEESLHDADFCAQHVDGLDALRAGVEDFTPEYVAERAGVPAEQMVAAARLFGRGPRGCATSGSGPDMAPHPNLSEHLISALNIVCGRVNREGEKIDSPGVLGLAVPRPAQAIPLELLPPLFSYGKEPAPRIRGVQQVCGEMPTPTLAEEILMPGDGQVRALICLGGNPAMAWPDERRTLAALASLDLLVCVDPKLTATACMADYVVAPRLPLEREDVTLFSDMFFELPYSHYTPAIVEPDFDVIDDWEFFVGLARRMGTPMTLPTGAIDLQQRLTKFDLLELITAGSRIPLARVRDEDGGHVFNEVEVFVDAPMPGMETRLQIVPSGIPEELREVRAEPIRQLGEFGEDGSFSHLLICRRLNEVMNSVGQDFPMSRAKRPTNPAYLNPADLDRMGVAAGGLVAISSEVGSILAVAEPTDEVQSGVVSMAHAWGPLPGQEEDVRNVGSNTNRLIATDRHFDPLSGMARQSAIPVNIRRADPGECR